MSEGEFFIADRGPNAASEVWSAFSKCEVVCGERCWRLYLMLLVQTNIKTKQGISVTIAIKIKTERRDAMLKSKVLF